MSIDGDQHVLSPAQARELRDALADAVTGRRQYLHTAGEHRADGSYVVERAGADSSGHRKVFDRFADVQTLFDRLPAEFTADDVERAAADGVSGGRCHMLVRHFAEHPGFDCSLSSRQPLTGAKRGSAEHEASDDTQPVTDEPSGVTRVAVERVQPDATDETRPSPTGSGFGEVATDD